MAAATYPIQYDAFSTYVLALTLYTDYPPVTPKNLTGYTASFKVADENGNVLLTLTSSSGIALGGTAGTIVVTITPAATASLTAIPMFYNLIITSGAGVVTRELQDSFTLISGVSSTQ